MFGLRTDRGLDLDAAVFDGLDRDPILDLLRSCADDGLLVHSGRSWSVTVSGALLVDEIAEEETRLPEVLCLTNELNAQGPAQPAGPPPKEQGGSQAGQGRADEDDRAYRIPGEALHQDGGSESERRKEDERDLPSRELQPSFVRPHLSHIDAEENQP